MRTFLLKKDTSQLAQITKSNKSKTSKQEKGRRKFMEKSGSMMESFRYDNKQKNSNTQSKDLLKEKNTQKRMKKSSSLIRQRYKDVSLEKSYYSCDEYRPTETP